MRLLAAETENPSLGTFLHGLRVTRGYSLERLAREAGVHERTLSFWEANTHKPRTLELDAVLNALRVSEQERLQAVLLLGERRTNRYLQEQRRNPQPTIQNLLLPLPSGGDLLRALRHRRRSQLGWVAAEFGVSISTLSRWESGKVVPDAQRLPSLLRVLGARPEERYVLLGNTLQGSRFSPVSEQDARSVEGLRENFRQFFADGTDCCSDELRDLGYLTFEAHAWRFAISQEEGCRLLAAIYASHASYLAAFGRYEEIPRYAQLATDLSPQGNPPSNAQREAAIALAQAKVYSGRSGAKPMKGALLLKEWEEQALAEEAVGTGHGGWLLADQAKYLAMGGHTEAALMLAERACALAERSGNARVEWQLPRRDQARILLDARRADEALSLLVPDSRDGAYWRARLKLMQAEGLLQMRENQAAETCLRQAIQDINLHDLRHLRDAAAEQLHAFRRFTQGG